MNRILVVCAHPDDETLGLGGTIKSHTVKKDSVFVLCFSHGQFDRDESEIGIKRREEQARSAFKILGVKNSKFLRYPDQKLDSISLTKLAKDIESIINKVKPNIVYTHFWEDMNQDHKRVFEASLIATRQVPKSSVTELICYETPSSTDWGRRTFQPNYFVDISKTVESKLKALKNYKDEVGKYPHPRSIKSVRSRASFWGTTVGRKFAEAFIIVRKIN